MVVDFPAPVGPRNPSTGPRSTANETWSTAVTPSNRLETPSTDRRGIPTSECVYRRSDANHTGPPSSSPPAVPGVRLQGLEKRDDGVPVRDGEGLEAVADARGFPASARPPGGPGSRFTGSWETGGWRSGPRRGGP